MELKITDCAIDTLGDIAEYISGNFNSRLARYSLETIIRRVNVLQHSPRLGRFVAFSERYGELRCLVLKTNLVYYRIKGERIEVIAVWDSRRSRKLLRAKILGYLASVE